MFKGRDRQRKIQTEIISKIKGNSERLSSCAKDAKLFEIFKKDRVRVVLHISINNKSQIEKFQLDDQQYPEKFSECMFKVVDLINYSKIKDNELVELEQPFIFSKK